MSLSCFSGQLQQKQTAAARSFTSKGQPGAGQKPPPSLKGQRPVFRGTGTKPVRPPYKRVDSDGGTVDSGSTASPGDSDPAFVPDADEDGSPSPIARPSANVRTPPRCGGARTGPSTGAAAAARLYSPPGVISAVPPASELIPELGVWCRCLWQTMLSPCLGRLDVCVASRCAAVS